MLLAKMILCGFVFTIVLTIPVLGVPPPPPDSLLLSRLVRLESLLADHQTRFQHERDQWQKEKNTLQGSVHALQRENQDIRKVTEALQHNAQTLAEAAQTAQHILTADIQDLKARLGDVQHQLSSVKEKQQSLQNLVTPCACRPTEPARAVVEEEDRPIPGDTSGGVDLGESAGPAVPTSEDQRDSKEVRDDHPVQRVGDLGPLRQRVRAARSDDQGPLEVVVNYMAQQVSQLSADVQALKMSDAQQQHNIQAAGGSTFVQWGSATCSGSSSELVYSGVMGGSQHSHSGAAADALCMSMSPRLQSPSSGVAYALLYGGEYETHDSRQDVDPVCAVCRAFQPTTLMVPGTNVCADGWTLQYSGFLMAGYYSHPAATQFICVDPKMDSETGSQANNNGYLLYYTKTQCGSLPCPPYENNKVLTCAVCSK